MLANDLCWESKGTESSCFHSKTANRMNLEERSDSKESPYVAVQVELRKLFPDWIIQRIKKFLFDFILQINQRVILDVSKSWYTWYVWRKYVSLWYNLGLGVVALDDNGLNQFGFLRAPNLFTMRKSWCKFLFRWIVPKSLPEVAWGAGALRPKARSWSINKLW